MLTCRFFRNLKEFASPSVRFNIAAISAGLNNYINPGYGLSLVDTL